MNKLYTPTTLFLAGVFMLGCQNDVSKKKKELPKLSQQHFSVDSISHWATELSLLKSLNPEFGDLAAALNNKMERALKEVKDSSMLKATIASLENKAQSISIVESMNKELTLISWDTRIGGSMGEYKNVAFLRSDQRILGTILEKTAISYDSIFGLQDPHGKSIYILSGIGKSSSFEYFMGLDAISIKEGRIVASNIFPNKKSSWKVFFSNEEMENLPNPGFHIDKNGTTIGHPVPLEKGTAWIPYVFKGSKFVEEVYQLENPIGEQDFVPQNEFQFMNGSEIPTSIEEGGFQFEDGTLVRERVFQEEIEENKMKVSVSNLNEDMKEVEYSNNLRLIGKLKNLILFDGGGLPENWLLYVYDLKKEQFTFSTYLANTMLIDDFLVLAKLSDNRLMDSKNINPCEVGHGRFEIFTIQLLKPYPQIQPTKLSYCAYIQ